MCRSVVLSSVLALSLCFAFEAHSRPVALLPVTSDEMIVLTDEFHDKCPVESNAAGVMNSKGQVASNVIGCWIYSSDDDTIKIVFFVEGKEPFGSSIPAEKFIKLNKPADPV